MLSGPPSQKDAGDDEEEEEADEEGDGVACAECFSGADEGGREEDDGEGENPSEPYWSCPKLAGLAG